MSENALPLPPPVASMGGERVAANYRYIAAYNEVVARISQRQQTLTLFVAIFTGLVTALVAGRDLLKGPGLTLDWLMLGFPAASVALTLLNTKYERLLSILRGYLAALERIGNAHEMLPSYNCDAGLIAQANTARRHHDLTCATLIVTYNGIAVGIFSSLSPLNNALASGVLGLIVIVALACVVTHFRMHRHRYQPLHS